MDIFERITKNRGDFTEEVLGIAGADTFIAADINNDQRISAVDILMLRSRLLGIIDNFPNNTDWKFLDAKQSFS